MLAILAIPHGTLICDAPFELSDSFRAWICGMARSRSQERDLDIDSAVDSREASSLGDAAAVTSRRRRPRSCAVGIGSGDYVVDVTRRDEQFILSQFGAKPMFLPVEPELSFRPTSRCATFSLSSKPSDSATRCSSRSTGGSHSRDPSALGSPASCLRSTPARRSSEIFSAGKRSAVFACLTHLGRRDIPPREPAPDRERRPRSAPRSFIPSAHPRAISSPARRRDAQRLRRSTRRRVAAAPQLRIALLLQHWKSRPSL